MTSASLKDWRKVPDADRRTIINKAFVHRPSFPPIMQEFDELRADFREGAESTCMLVTGETGVGKSTLVEHYEAANLPYQIETEFGFQRITPVLAVSLKGIAVVSGAAQTILKKLLRTPSAPGKGITDFTDRIEHQLKLQQVEILILDEFQHLAERGADKTRHDTADWIKSLAKATKVPIVMVGMPSLGAAVDTNSQLDSICLYRRGLQQFSYDGAKARNSFSKFLDRLDEVFPFNARSNFSDPDTAEDLFMASGGNPRRLCRLLQLAAKRAVAERAQCVRREDLEYAFNKVGSRAGIIDVNPFSEEEQMRKVS